MVLTLIPLLKYRNFNKILGSLKFKFGTPIINNPRQRLSPKLWPSVNFPRATQNKIAPSSLQNSL